MSDIEHELKKRFAELRADDEANAPTYAAVRDRPRAGVAPIRAEVARRRWIAPTLLAAAAAIIAVVWISTRSASERLSDDALLGDSAMTIIRWTMPTDGLLESARRTLQTPALSSSVLDAAAVPIPGTPFKGD